MHELSTYGEKITQFENPSATPANRPLEFASENFLILCYHIVDICFTIFALIQCMRKHHM